MHSSDRQLVRRKERPQSLSVGTHRLQRDDLAVQQSQVDACVAVGARILCGGLEIPVGRPERIQGELHHQSTSRWMISTSLKSGSYTNMRRPMPEPDTFGSIDAGVIEFNGLTLADLLGPTQRRVGYRDSRSPGVAVHALTPTR